MLKKLLTMLLMMMLLSTCVLACGQKLLPKPTIAVPPIPANPRLESLSRDKNDRTKEDGWWINSVDMKELGSFFMKIDALRTEWKPEAN